MKFQVILISCLAAVVLAAPQQDESQAKTIRSDGNNNELDKYNFLYETSNGIFRSEDGQLKTIEDNSAFVVQGNSAWTAPDGQKFETSFTADESGYHPSFKLVA